MYENSISLRDRLLFKNSLIVELDIDNLSKSIVFYNSIHIDKNKVTHNFIDINFLYRDFMFDSFLYFNAKIKEHNKKEGFCIVDVKMRKGFQIYLHIVYSIIMLVAITLSFMGYAVFPTIILMLVVIIINHVYMNSLFTNSTTSLIRELKEINPRYAKKYDEELQRRKQPRRR